MYVIADAHAVSSLKDHHGEIIELDTGGELLMRTKNELLACSLS